MKCHNCNLTLFVDEEELGICDVCVEEMEEEASDYEHATGKE
jgi:hypothetical protein